MSCKQCGADLPEGAQFCLQCGTRVAPVETPQAKLDFVQPALAGGMALGILSAIPFIQLGNCLCCMWVLGGGALCTYLLIQQRPAGITYGDGAFGGVLSGLIGSVVATVIGIPVRLLTARTFESQRERLEQMMRDLGIDGSSEFQELFLQLTSSEITALSLLFSFLGNALVYSLFAMIGGILMVALMQRK